ncbi:hypothetical protein HY932_00265 [Candidatus Falkowbacteria bacterium]|nr:hypothetical protein [Candidatus Falkowbacteria bacterium]
MKKGTKKGGKGDVKKAEEKKVECGKADGGSPTATATLEAQFAAEIAGAIALPEADAEEKGRQVAAELAAKAKSEADAAALLRAEPKLGDVVGCIGLECGRKFALSERTLVVRDGDTIQPLCWGCAEAARRANLAFLPYGIWQERRDKFAAKVEELRGLNVQSTGGSKKALHEALLELGEEDLDRAIVVSTRDVSAQDVPRGIILPNKFALAAFFKTHPARRYFVDGAKELLDRFEREEREAQKQEAYFRNLAAQKQKKFAARGQRRQQADRARSQQFADMAAGGNGGKPAVQPQPSNGGGNGDRAPALREFGIEIPTGVQVEASGLKSSPFAGLSLKSDQ